MKNAVIENDVYVMLKKADNIIQNTISNIKNEVITMYFKIGEMVVTYRNNNSSKYGESAVSSFVNELSLKHGVVFSKSYIYCAIKFYEIFEKFQTSGKFTYKNLTWSHIIEILNLNDVNEIKYYINEVEDKKLTIKEIREDKLNELILPILTK